MKSRHLSGVIMLLIKKAMAALVYTATWNFTLCETVSKFQQIDIEATSWRSGAKQGRQVLVEI